MASSAPSCEPDTNTMRRLDRSGLCSIASRASRMRDSITGTTTIAVTLCFSMSSSTVAGLKRRRSTSVVPSIIAMVACRKPSAWNIGAGKDVISPYLNGTWDRMPPIGASDGGVLLLAPLGVPVVPLVKMMIEECFVDLGRGLAAAARDEVFQRLVGAARRLVLIGVDAERPQLAQRRIGLGNRLAVLVVVNDQLGALALGHLLDLRPAELAVEQDDARSGAGGAVDGDQEPAVVARQDRHPVATLDPHRQQAIGHLVAGVVELLEGDLAVVVDDRGAVGRAPRVERGNHAELAPAPDVGNHRGDVLRRLQPEARRPPASCRRSAALPNRVRRTAGFWPLPATEDQ